MAVIYDNIEELIGNTPLIRLNRYMNEVGAKADILAKIEYFNPAGSSKDRAALYMLDKAQNEGLIEKGSVIIEPTSGNTGIGLAMISSERGYRLILTMPDSMSQERQKLLSAYGAEIILTDGKLGMKGAIDKANELLAEIPGSFMPSQFSNIANAEAHFRTTGPEIFDDTDGKVDVVVAGVGTGGTLTGTGKFLKGKKPSVKIVAVEPVSSAVLSGKKSGLHKLQGIGAGFVPEVLDVSLMDEIVTVSDENAYATTKLLVEKEGFLCGISSGAALYAATQLAKSSENSGKNIVVILPDSGERYLSVEGLF